MEPINDMSIFIKRSAAGSNLYPPRIACYVCGAEVPSDYPLFPEPSPPSPPPPSLASITAIMSKPHFPFLMHHPPPLGCRPPSPGGVAKSCRVCYSALMRQWDDFERTGVPTDRRVYWLRRNDGLSFASPEVQVQAASEVKSRILGQFQHHPRSPHHHLMRTSSPRSTMAAPAINVSHAPINLLQQHPNVHPATETNSLSSNDRLKASSPLTVVTGNSSMANSPMATPTSHGHHGSSIASSWLSRSAIVSGETRPHSGQSPLFIGHSGVSSSAPSSVIVETVHQHQPHSTQSPKTPPQHSSPHVIAPVQHCITDNDSGALDLSSGTRDRETKSRSSVVSHISTGAASHQGSCQSDGTASTSATRATSSGTAADILDLTLPDKNASFEVCYICGDDFKRGTLSYTFAKQVSSPKEPFYPSLMCHPRPPRSRPMDSAGRVQTCDECHEHLLAQWNQFEEEGANDSSELVPHADRNYSLRKRQPPLADTTTFVCYICALDYHSSSLRLLYARPNSEQEPYYPFIDQQRPPPGASPISPQGMVQVCTLCYKSTKEKHHGFMKESQPPLKKRRGNAGSCHAFSLPRDPTDSNSPFGTDPIPPFGDSDEKHQQMFPADVTCPLCRRKFSVGSFKYLHSQPPPAGGLPYFPFLSELPRPDDYIDADEDKQSRVRACKACTTSLFNQWTTFQSEKLSIEDRNYMYQTLTGPRSSQNITRPLTPSSIRSHRSGGGKSDRGSKKPNETTSGSNSDELKCGSGIRPRSYSNPFGDQTMNSASNINHTRTRSTTLESIPRSDSNPMSPAQARCSAAGQQPPVCHSPSFSVNSAASVEHLPAHSTTTTTTTAGATTSAAIPINKLSTGGGNSGTTSSPPSSSSFYCFLCGLHSELTFARMLYSTAPGKKAPFFPFMKSHVPKHKAETLREDGTALVCTFCYHSVMSQWSRYNGSSSGAPHSAILDPSSRLYNFSDYICYVCGITTYRKRIRALRVMVSHILIYLKQQCPIYNIYSLID